MNDKMIVWLKGVLRYLMCGFKRYNCCYTEISFGKRFSSNGCLGKAPLFLLAFSRSALRSAPTMIEVSLEDSRSEGNTRRGTTTNSSWTKVDFIADLIQ